MTMEIEELKKQIADFIEMERRSCSMDHCSPEYVARCLQLPLEEVKQAMASM